MTSRELRQKGFHQTADAVELFELVQQQHRELERQYQELVMAVARKWPDESRHATALRYIREAEQACVGDGDRCKDASPPAQSGARVET